MQRRNVIGGVALGLVFACKPGLPGVEGEGSSSDTTSAETGDGTMGTGAEQGSEDSETTGPLACEPELLEACWSDAAAGLSACADACACDDVACTVGCHDAYDASFSDCFEQHCEDPLNDDCDGVCYSTTSCQAVCGERSSSCADAGCDANVCMYQRLSCLDACGLCAGSTFEFSYADACEIVLPGPPPPSFVPNVSVVIDGQPWPLFEPGTPCDDSEIYVIWADEQLDRLLLCPAACEAFATTGEAYVDYGCAPG